MNKFNILGNRLFKKVFFLIFLAIFLVLTIFLFKAVQLQKQSIIESLQLEAKTMADGISYLNRNSMIVDDQIKILEFLIDYVKVNNSIESIIIKRKNNYSFSVKKDSWNLEENIGDEPNDSKNSYEIIESSDSNKKVFKYTYVISFSSVSWGWFHVNLSLDEYNRKIDVMYTQFIFFGFIMFLTSLLLSYFVARMVSNPIIKLNEITNEISNGKLNKRVDIKTNDEIGTLADSFNKMINNLEISQKELRRSHDELEDRVQIRTQELEDASNKLKLLNETLEQRVSTEILKRQNQEQLLIQQSKLAAMGEMIGNIAHQWRQPLNALSLVFQNIYFSYKLDELDDEFMDKSIKKANLLTNTMSKTIDDFRNFFKPNKEKKEFLLDDVISKSLAIIDSTFKHANINLLFTFNEPIYVFGFSNEFSQVILNILNNSKDALLENKIEDATVNVRINKDDNFAYVSICDNAGGIPNDIIDKVFNPYFTTKDEGKGTGIGLYMSKTIIESNMDGKLIVKNLEEGAEFIIKVPLLKVINEKY